MLAIEQFFDWMSFSKDFGVAIGIIAILGLWIMARIRRDINQISGG